MGYHVKLQCQNIPHDARQMIIIIIFDEKCLLNSVVLRECERASITLGLVKVS